MPNITIVRNKNGALMGVAVESTTPRPENPVPPPVEARTPDPRVQSRVEAPAAVPQEEAQSEPKNHPRYSCPDCSFTAASTSGLSSHRRARHGA